MSDKVLNDYFLSALKLLNNNDRTITIFELKYGLLDNKELSLGDLSSIFNLNEGEVLEILELITKQLRAAMELAFKTSDNNVFFKLFSYLKNDTDKNNVMYKLFIEEKSTKELIKSAQTPILNSPINSTKPHELEIDKIIYFCIFSLKQSYGKSGITKILKGSQAIKDNDFNTEALNSKYFGILKDMTGENIKKAIDKLLDKNALLVKKIAFGRPILEANPDYDGFSIENEADKENEEPDENIKKILELLKNKKNIFITGHAGTGKSNILNKLKEKLKYLTTTSTTGIAAVNIKGQTLHSWAGVGICNKPIEAVLEKIKAKPAIKKQIKECRLLAVDEVSMLDIKTFEYVDKVLKAIRDCNLPFGGIQTIFIGDFFQLPPVEKRENEADNRLKFCFESPLWKDFNFSAIVLNKNYRQNEQNLVKALSNMRVNSLTADDIRLLNQRNCDIEENLEDVLHIFATNAEADNYNSQRFQKRLIQRFII